MAYFLVWMAHFFKTAIFWNYMDFTWFIGKDKDFLQVQREYCQRLCIDILSFEKCLKAMEASTRTQVLNKNQCIHLFRKLILAIKGIDKILSSASEDLKFQSIFEELCFLQRKVEIVGKNCTDQDQWCHLVVYQIQSKETFRELLLDLKCCYNTACEMYLLCHPNQLDNIISIQFDAATHEQVLEDGQELKNRLEQVLLEGYSEDYEMAQHLLLRFRNLDRVDGGDLDALEVLNHFNAPKLIKHIGEGSNANVYYSNWLGLACATKVLKGDSSFLINSRKGSTISEGNSSLFNNSLKEAGILASLSHPNLVQFFGCGITKSFDENIVEVETGDMYLVMEPMETSLSTILENAKEPLPYHLAIDIMHQIAKGVCYLHDMQVAHLDLKPANVLSSRVSNEDPYCIFKVTDYDTSQLKVCTNPKNPKPSMYTIGTRGYMAPEMMKGSETPLYPFQADVWSFAMICSKILSRNDPYFDLKHKGKHGTDSKNLRPNLPKDCEGLTNLIQECWCEDPLQRPPFFKICKRLTGLKKSFLKGTLKDSKSILNLVPKVDEPISPLKEIPVDLDHQLSKAKGLLKLNYIGIVGMGGIGKTTLAKAIFDDATVKSSYHASCFVVQCKEYQSPYDILCEILPKLGNQKIPNNYTNAQEMMKLLLVGKKVLLILDDIKDEAQVHGVVPPDILKASKGSCIIITTCNWNTIKSFVGIEGKLDVGLLDEKAATTLFTTHLSWGVAPLSPDFEDLRKHVVKACNGLPLSLKVMGAFLRTKERLRNWEQALQVMARGRNLDGDEEIWNTLQISYDGLNNGVEKGMFLDVACFFCSDVYPSGISREAIFSMWSKDGILPIDELGRLIDMSLLKVNRDSDILEMHDQLRDMGRKIAMDTRIWKASMIPESGFSSEDAKVLEGISLQGNMNHHLPKIKDDQNIDFEKLRVLILVSSLGNPQVHVDNLGLLLQLASQCSKLEAMIIENSTTSIRFPHLLEVDTTITVQSKIADLCGTCASLKILDLIGLKFLEKIPRKFASSNILMRLNLSGCSSLVTLPKEVGSLSSLTTLNLSGCSRLVGLPKEIGTLSSLATLNLKKCSSLAALPKEVEGLSSLTILNLKNCTSLATLPKEVGNLSSLTSLILKWCSNLVALPNELGNLSSLTTLDLEDCSSLEVLPKEVGNLSSLTTLNLTYCKSLTALPKELESLSSLTTLHLKWCSNLRILLKGVGSLSSLTNLDLRGCSSLVALPKEMGNLSSLTILDLWKCSKLTTLPKEIGSLSSLTTFDLGDCSSLASLPKEVGSLSSLIDLDLRGCSSLVALPEEVRNLSSLTNLNLSRCSSLATLPKEVGNLSSLTTLYLANYSNLVALPMEVGKLSSLITLHLFRCSSLAILPKEVGNLSSLTTFNLGHCSSLVVLPKEVGNLSSLTTFNLGHCSSLVVLPKEVGNLSSLTVFDLSWCLSLKSLPMEIGNLSSLTTFKLKGCSSLVTLPKEVRSLSSLTTLNLSGWSSLVALPEEVWNLSSLTTLYLGRYSSFVALPKEVWNLSSLTTLHLKRCSSLVALPKELKNLSLLTTLNLRSCSSLMDLPKEIGSLSSLTTLALCDCSSLVALPKEVGSLSSLTTLDLNGCSSLVALLEEVGNLYSLTHLHLIGCSSLVALPKEVGNLSSLTTFTLCYCPSLIGLPKEVGSLSSLTCLGLSGSSGLVVLPKEVGNLSSLTNLDCQDCSSLVTLPKEVGNLSSLINLDLNGCSSLVALPKEVGNLFSLTDLNLRGCSSLVALPKEVGNLFSLTDLNLSGCSSLVALPKEVANLSSFINLDLSGCSSLVVLPKEVWNVSPLTTLDLSDC